MFKKNSIASALILAAFALSASASAETYLGATVGQAKWNIDCTGAVSCKTADTAFKVLVGYELAPLWSLEASYFSLGEVGVNDASVKGTFSARGIDVAGVVKTAPMKGFVGFAKMGVAYVRGKPAPGSAHFRVTIKRNRCKRYLAWV
ncbi:hypothetical protein BH11PSE12_BH11PSE12_25600 [soil metagenome]